MQTEPLLASLLTPPGSGAIAAIGIRGAMAQTLLASHFLPRRTDAWRKASVGRVLLGDWRRDDGTSEELLLVRVAEEDWEIHCHGGVAAVETILADLRRRDVVVVPWSDWLELHSPDPLRHAAQRELSRATTPRTAAVLLDQYRGALRGTILDILSKLEQVLASRDRCNSGELDQESTDQESTEREKVAELQRMLTTLLDRWPVGSHLTHPWRVALVGPPNVGKSSLLNRILGYDRAIVFDQPGTTRDVVTAQTALDGWPVELSDTAGMRETADTMEQAGVALAQQAARQADLVVLLAEMVPWVADENPTALGSSSDRPVPLLQEFHAFQEFKLFKLASSITCVKVLSKWDLRRGDERLPRGWLGVSSETGEGIDKLIDTVVDQLIPHPPQPGDPVPFLSVHQRQLAKSLEAVRQGDWDRAKRELESLLTKQTEV